MVLMEVIVVDTFFIGGGMLEHSVPLVYLVHKNG